MVRVILFFCYFLTKPRGVEIAYRIARHLVLEGRYIYTFVHVFF